MIEWVLWAFFLLAQNFSQTASQRAKTMDNLRYTALTGVFSNGTWFVANSFMVSKLVKSEDASQFVLALMFYTFWCVIGTVTSQYCAMRWFENWRKK